MWETTETTSERISWQHLFETAALLVMRVSYKEFPAVDQVLEVEPEGYVAHEVPLEFKVGKDCKLT